MKVISILFILLCIFFLLGCEAKLEKENDINIELVNQIDFGKIDIPTSFEVTRTKIFLVFYNQNYIGIYDHKGKLMSTFGRKGKGPGEFQMISYMFVDENDQKINVFDASLRKLSNFDYNGYFISSKSTETIFPFFEKKYKPVQASAYREISKINNKVIFSDIVKYNFTDSSFIIKEKRYYDLEKAFNQQLIVESNDNSIFILERENNKLNLEQYDLSGNRFIWQFDNQTLQISKKREVQSIFVGNKFILLGVGGKKKKDNYLAVYDISQKYLGKISNIFDKVEVIGVYIFEDYLYVLIVEEENILCKIYDIGV